MYPPKYIIKYVKEIFRKNVFKSAGKILCVAPVMSIVWVCLTTLLNGLPSYSVRFQTEVLSRTKIFTDRCHIHAMPNNL